MRWLRVLMSVWRALLSARRSSGRVWLMLVRRVLRMLRVPSSCGLRVALACWARIISR